MQVPAGGITFCQLVALRLMLRKHDEIPVAAVRNGGHHTPTPTTIAEAFLNPEWKSSCSNVRHLYRFNKSNVYAFDVGIEVITKGLCVAKMN